MKMNAANLWLITGLEITLFFLIYVTVASASDFAYKLPCIISYDGKPPITTNCIATIGISQGVVVETVKTPNGRTFITENDPSNLDEWYLDHDRAVKVSSEPITCYQNKQVKICL